MADRSNFTLDVSSDINDPERVETFATLAHGVHNLLASVAAEWGAEPIHLEAFATDALQQNVQATLKLKGDTQAHTFGIERVGGIVAAKNLALADDGSHVRIVFDAGLCTAPDPQGQAWAIFLLAHEFCHAVLERLRGQSGAMEGVVLPSRTPTEMARSICRIAADEYRCDIVADTVLGLMVTVGDGHGTTRPMRYGDVTEGSYNETVAGALDDAIWPALPRTVRDYQERRIALEPMWKRVVETTDQTFTLLAHAEAEAHTLDRATPLLDGSKTHPGAVKLLNDAWLPFIDRFHSLPLVPEVSEWCAHESDLLDHGQQLLFELWDKLGITPYNEADDGGFGLRVRTPIDEESWL